MLMSRMWMSYSFPGTELCSLTTGMLNNSKGAIWKAALPGSTISLRRWDRLLSCAAEILRAALPKRGFMSGRLCAEDFALLLSRWMADRVTARAGGWESRELTPGMRWFPPLLFELHDFLFVRLFCFCVTVCTMHLLGFKGLLSLCHQWFQ